MYVWVEIILLNMAAVKYCIAISVYSLKIVKHNL